MTFEYLALAIDVSISRHMKSYSSSGKVAVTVLTNPTLRTVRHGAFFVGASEGETYGGRGPELMLTFGEGLSDSGSIPGMFLLMGSVFPTMRLGS